MSAYTSMRSPKEQRRVDLREPLTYIASFLGYFSKVPPMVGDVRNVRNGGKVGKVGEVGKVGATSGKWGKSV